MKKLLLGSIALLLFSISVMIFQSSCSRVVAQPSGTVLNKILYVDFNNEVWIANLDNSNAKKINFALPPNVTLEFSFPRRAMQISPDGQKIYFSGTNYATNESGIYCSDINGNNVVIVKVGTGGTQPMLLGVY